MVYQYSITIPTRFFNYIVKNDPRNLLESEIERIDNYMSKFWEHLVSIHGGCEYGCKNYAEWQPRGEIYHSLDDIDRLPNEVVDIWMKLFVDT